MAELVKHLALLPPSTSGSSMSFYATVPTAATDVVVSVAALTAGPTKPTFSAPGSSSANGFVRKCKYDDIMMVRHRDQIKQVALQHGVPAAALGLKFMSGQYTFCQATCTVEANNIW